jgi:hypothetical protein
MLRIVSSNQHPNISNVHTFFFIIWVVHTENEMHILKDRKYLWLKFHIGKDSKTECHSFETTATQSTHLLINLRILPLIDGKWMIISPLNLEILKGLEIHVHISRFKQMPNRITKLNKLRCCRIGLGLQLKKTIP